MTSGDVIIDAGNPRFYAGRMLLALPGMADRNFHRAAITMCVHDEHGAMGIDVGTAVEGLSVAELMANFEIDAPTLTQAPVMRGGPVEPQRGFVLHSMDWDGQDMVQVGPEWGLSGSLDILKAIAANEGPDRYIIALGYSGWGAGQLEHEMTMQGWFLGDVIPAELAQIEPRQRWETCFAASGVDVRLLSGDMGQA